MTSCLETSRYPDFSQFFVSIGLGLENIWSQKKVSVSVSKILVSKKSLGIGLDETFWSRHSVEVKSIICLFFSHKVNYDFCDFKISGLPTLELS